MSEGIHGFDERVEDPRRLDAMLEEGHLGPQAYAAAATHLFSTARMGSDPSISVVRPDFRHHGVEGLYVADSSVFPSSTGVNPSSDSSVAGALAKTSKPPPSEKIHTAVTNSVAATGNAAINGSPGI